LETFANTLTARHTDVFTLIAIQVFKQISENAKIYTYYGIYSIV